MRSPLTALVIAVALTGCIISNERGPNAYPEDPGDITFRWTFSGKTCQQAPEVYNVQVELIGPGGKAVLENGGLFRCNTAGEDGIRLLNFAPGNYTFTIDAIDGGNKVVYTTTGTLHVNGNVTIPVTLNPVGQQGGVDLFWSFGAAERAGCAAAGISSLWVTVDSGARQSVPCSVVNAQGVTVEGVNIGNLTQGTHYIDLEAVKRATNPANGQLQDQIWYFASISVVVDASRTTRRDVALDWVAAGATFVPVILNSSNQPISCATAGVRALAITLTDWRGNTTPEAFDSNCEALLAQGFQFPYLLADEAQTTGAVWYAGWTVKIDGWNEASTAHQVIKTSGQVTKDIQAGPTIQTLHINLR